MLRALAITLAILAAAALLAHTGFAQNTPAHQMPAEGQMRMAGTPTLPGQDAFGAIAEVVALLDADPSTDWSKVKLERLRQHLIDMNEVVLRSEVMQTSVPDGLAMEITGTGRTERAIHAMVIPHASELNAMPDWSAKTESIPGGVRLIVITKKSGDEKALARLRGLGFIGLLTAGAHHSPHHLAMAKGETLSGHGHSK